MAAPLLRLRSDEQLVALFRAGSEQAFQVIHDRYRQRLFAYARQMLAGSRQDAEDALQDVFLRAYGALRSSDRPISLRAWLYRVAHNRCIDHLRRPTPPACDVFEVSRSPLHDPMTTAERREDLRRLVEDVRRLPEQQRSALLMRELEGLPYAELADALGVTVPAVKSLLVRARIGLVEAIEARDTDCAEIRADLALSHGKGVRASGLARRHLRDCRGCRDYRARMKGLQEGFAALAPAGPGPLALVAKVLGLGGAGSGAAASGGGGAAAGAGAVAAGTGAVGATATKVAALVCTAAITVGGAAEVRDHIGPSAAKDRAATKAQRAPAAGTGLAAGFAPGGALRPGDDREALAARRVVASAARPGAGAKAKADRAAATAPAAGEAVGEEPISPHATVEEPAKVPVNAQELATGGLQAPDEEPGREAAGAGEGTAVAPAAGTPPAESGTTGAGGTGTAGETGTGPPPSGAGGGGSGAAHPPPGGSNPTTVAPGPGGTPTTVPATP